MAFWNRKDADKVPNVPTLGGVGTAGVKRTTNYVQEEWHRKLSGRLGMSKYREMYDNEPNIGGAMWAIESILRGSKPRFDASGETPEHEQWAEFGDECLNDLESSWTEVFGEILSSLPFGYSLIFESFKIRRGESDDPIFNSNHNDGRIGWRDLEARAQETIDEWIFDESTGRAIAAIQVAAPDYRRVPIPLDRCLHFRMRPTKNNPEGRSQLRNAYRPYHFKTRTEEYEAIGTSRKLAGMPVIRLPPKSMEPNASAEQKAMYTEAKEQVQKVAMDQIHGVVFPAAEDKDGKTGFDFNLMAASGDTGAQADVIIRRYRSEILISLISEFLALGMDQVGSRSVAGDKIDLWESSLIAIQDMVSEIFNRKAVPDLMRLNNVPREFWPVFVFEPINAEDVIALTTAFGNMVNAGVIVPADQDEAWMREKIGAPLREDDGAEDREPEDEGAEVIDFPTPDKAPAEDPKEEATDEIAAGVAEGEAASPATSLNGAQIASLLEVIGQVSRRELPREAAVNIIATAFNLDSAKADELIGAVGKTFFAPSETDTEMPPAV